MRITRRVLLASSSAMVVMTLGQILGGCSNPSGPTNSMTSPSPSTASSKASAPSGAPVVNLYTARHYEADNQVYEAF